MTRKYKAPWYSAIMMAAGFWLESVSETIREADYHVRNPWVSICTLFVAAVLDSAAYLLESLAVKLVQVTVEDE